jgi:type I restriction enzyme S subunit
MVEYDKRAYSNIIDDWNRGFRERAIQPERWSDKSKQALRTRTGKDSGRIEHGAGKVTNEQGDLPRLPRGWVWTDTGSLSWFVTSGSRNWRKYYSGSGALFIRTQDISMNRLSLENKVFVKLPEKVEGKRSLVEKNDLLVGITGHVGKAALVDRDIGEAYVSQSVALMKLVFPETARFVHLAMITDGFGKTQLERMVYGMGRPVLNLQNIRNVMLPLPPLAEQNRILSRIEELFSRLNAGVEALLKVKTQLKRYRQAVLKYAFEGKLTEEWRKTHKHQTQLTTRLPKRVRQDDEEYVDPPSTNRLALNGLPENWSWEKIGAIADLISGQHIMKEDYNFDQSGLPYLTGPADFGSESPIVSKWTTKPKVVAKDGDVLVTVKGAGVGKVNILEIKEAVISRQLMAIRARHARPKFVFHYVQYTFDNIRKMGSGSTVPGIRREELLGLLLPFPSIAEQDQIVSEIENRMQVVVDVEKTLAQSSRQAERLRQSILKHAFEGKLVHQDPSDEPAEKLLQRIKEEPAKSKGEKYTNKKKIKPKQLELSTYVK